jgi:membrane-associated phospholipid phosphatase
VLAAAVLVTTRREWRSVARLAAALGGSVALAGLTQQLVGRARPPAAMRIGYYSGPAFPSGHATQAIAFYGMLTIILAAGRPARGRALLWAAAAAVTIVAGGSGLYLGANWLTDVLGGYALGALWIALILTVDLLRTRDGRPQPATPRAPMNSRPATRQETEPGTGAGASWREKCHSLFRTERRSLRNLAQARCELAVTDPNRLPMAGPCPAGLQAGRFPASAL